jgi:hypothetical protein
MARLLLGNIEPGTSDDEIRAFLTKYGFPEIDEIASMPGAGSRPGVLVTFRDMDLVVLGNLQKRIHDMQWKNRKLSAQILRDGFN